MKEIEVIYENGVFKPLKPIKLKNGTRARVLISSSCFLETTRKYRAKVKEDVLHKFVEERR